MEEHSLTADLLESELTIKYKNKLNAYIANHPLHFAYMPNEEGYSGTKNEITQKLIEDVLNSDETYKKSVESFYEHFPGHKEPLYGNFYLTTLSALALYNHDDYFN